MTRRGLRRLALDLSIDRIVRYVRVELLRNIPRTVTAVSRRKSELRWDRKQLADAWERHSGAREFLCAAMLNLGMIWVRDSKVRPFSVQVDEEFVTSIESLVAFIRKRGVNCKCECLIGSYKGVQVAFATVWINKKKYCFVPDLDKPT